MSMSENAKRGAEVTVNAAKLLGALSVIVTVAGSLWVQFFGPGFWWLTGMAGLEARLSERIDAKLDPVASDVAFILANMPAPRVVDWDEAVARQAGDCTSAECEYILGGSRTTYGEACGRPTIQRVELRGIDGRTFDVGFDPEWIPVMLRRQPVIFSVDLMIPEYVPAGTYSWRSHQLYESCTGVGEPIIRFSPWWPLAVSQQQ